MKLSSLQGRILISNQLFNAQENEVKYICTIISYLLDYRIHFI